MNIAKLLLTISFLALLVCTSCAISTKSRRESDLKNARFEGFVSGCTFAANGVAAQLGLGIQPEALSKICNEQAGK